MMKTFICTDDQCPNSRPCTMVTADVTSDPHDCPLCCGMSKWVQVNVEASPGVLFTKFKPEQIKDFPQYHSTPDNTVLLLIAFKPAERFCQPLIGHYIGSLDQFRMAGSPSPWEILWWSPLPSVL